MPSREMRGFGDYPQNRMVTSCNTPCFLLTNRGIHCGAATGAERALAGTGGLEGHRRCWTAGWPFQGRRGLRKGRGMQAYWTLQADTLPWGDQLAHHGGSQGVREGRGLSITFVCIPRSPLHPPAPTANPAGPRGILGACNGTGHLLSCPDHSSGWEMGGWRPGPLG